MEAKWARGNGRGETVRELQYCMRRDFEKFPGDFFFNRGNLPKLVEVQHDPLSFKISSFNASTLHAAHAIVHRCVALPLERIRRLFFFRYAKPRALAPSVQQ